MAAADLVIRPMTETEWDRVAELIYDSTNAWYVGHGRPPIFTGSRTGPRVFCEVYERLDPGCCLVADDQAAGRLAGSCFYHPRATHVSLGIMNVHPDYFGHRVARRLLERIIAVAESQDRPVRLVSSAMNLDSFSLYNRAGFVPRQVYQDLILAVPPEGLVDLPATHAEVQTATRADLNEMIALEEQVHHISRPQDLEHFVANELGIWQTVIRRAGDGSLAGWLVSVSHPACTMIGPGVIRDEQTTIALLAEQLQRLRGRQPVWLVPSDARSVIEQCYRWGARNCELHFAQCRGPWQPPQGVVMPTFLPETS